MGWRLSQGRTSVASLLAHAGIAELVCYSILDLATSFAGLRSSVLHRTRKTLQEACGGVFVIRFALATINSTINLTTSLSVQAYTCYAMHVGQNRPSSKPILPSQARALAGWIPHAQSPQLVNPSLALRHNAPFQAPHRHRKRLTFHHDLRLTVGEASFARSSQATITEPRAKFALAT